MESMEKNTREYYVVDLAHIVKAVWHRIWVVALVSILCAAMAFSMAAFVIAPTYSSSIMLYVNNGSFNVGDIGFSISSSEITAAQSLAKTYTVLLKNRTILERLIAETGVDYTWKEIYNMIQAGSVDGTVWVGSGSLPQPARQERASIRASRKQVVRFISVYLLILYK